MGGRCVCNGHAGTCDILDQRRPRAFLCRWYSKTNKLALQRSVFFSDASITHAVICARCAVLGSCRRSGSQLPPRTTSLASPAIALAGRTSVSTMKNSRRTNSHSTFMATMKEEADAWIAEYNIKVLITLSNSKFSSSTPKESTATSVHSDITDLREFSGTRPCLANVRIAYFFQKQYRSSGCQCDPNKHTDGCAESTGKCECQVRISC